MCDQSIKCSTAVKSCAWYHMPEPSTSSAELTWAHDCSDCSGSTTCGRQRHLQWSFPSHRLAFHTGSTGHHPVITNMSQYLPDNLQSEHTCPLSSYRLRDTIIPAVYSPALAHLPIHWRHTNITENQTRMLRGLQSAYDKRAHSWVINIMLARINSDKGEV